MTEDRKNEHANESRLTDPRHLDLYLQALVHLVNGTELEIPISLFLNGLIVSGRLVSGHRYFYGIRPQLTQMFGGDPEDKSGIVSKLTSPGDSYLEERSESNPPSQYIHLQNAKIFTPGQKPIPDGDGVWWRGRLESVGGFHFGSLSVSEGK